VAENTYEYERGEGRYKHVWDKPYAGFEPSPKGPVGKCANTITQDVARRLLNEGIAVPDNAQGPHPECIVNQYQGAIYMAKPTRKGISYHGFPWRGDLGSRLPRRVLQQLEQRAEAEGHLPEYKKWIKEFGSKK